ncbi:unnamed protein product [Rhizoctonia solani]|uniref:Uncharacterized protein n=1 Tax=Rhizoctonia solani TaxID=456999 RepID=A0A8H3C9X8_9AGAM|nr:unnamed protein product [Rhizoctonia solani]
MPDSNTHKEDTPSSPLSDMSTTSPHYQSPQYVGAYGSAYDPYTSHQALTNPINGGKSGPKEAYHEPRYTYTDGGSTRRRPWWMLGFERKTTVGLFIFFGGAILGFSLSRTPLLSFSGLLKMTTAGEGYWYEQAPFKANIIIHICTSLPASFFSTFLFLPITWNRWPRAHGILGYILSTLLAVSLVCGAIVGRRGQGGDVNVQSAVYMLASASAYSVVMGCLEARRGAIDAHREYMLRAWFYNGAFVTTRVTALLSAQVITAVNGYYSLWKCAEVGYVLKTVDALVRAYPECGTPLARQEPRWVHVGVHSSWNEGKLGRASAIRASFGMALWVAMILHFVGIELYLRYTLDEGKKWRTGRVVAQQTNATCDKSFDWAKNSKGQSPCLVAAYLQGQCYPNKQWNVTSLPSGAQYIAPTNQEVTGCACSSPVYSLLSACAACQGGTYATWGQWTAGCSSGLINNGSFPFQVPADTALPQWALKSIAPNSYFDPEDARGGSSNSLSGATVFLIVLLPILLVGIGGITAWVWWQRRKRRTRRASMAGKEPLLRPTGSRHTIISLDTTSEIHIQLTRKSMESLQTQYGYDKHAQPSPVPTTPSSLGYSSHASPSSPGAQYAYYPTDSGYQPNQPFLAPPSAATSLGLGPQHHSAAPTQPQTPPTGGTGQTFASQIEANRSRPSSEPVVIENDSGTFPRTPVEPQLPTLSLGDRRRLLPPSVRANEPTGRP